MPSHPPYKHAIPLGLCSTPTLEVGVVSLLGYVPLTHLVPQQKPQRLAHILHSSNTLIIIHHNDCHPYVEGRHGMPIPLGLRSHSHILFPTITHGRVARIPHSFIRWNDGHPSVEGHGMPSHPPHERAIPLGLRRTKTSEEGKKARQSKTQRKRTRKGAQEGRKEGRKGREGKEGGTCAASASSSPPSFISISISIASPSPSPSPSPALPLLPLLPAAAPAPAAHPAALAQDATARKQTRQAAFIHPSSQPVCVAAPLGLAASLHVARQAASIWSP